MRFIIALNIYLTAVLLVPKHLKFHSSYCRVKLIKVKPLNYRIRQVGRTLLAAKLLGPYCFCNGFFSDAYKSPLILSELRSTI